MNAKENPPTLDDPRVVAALDEYLAALEAGQKPNRQAFLARHADIAEPLAECLEGMEALYVAGSSTGEGSGTNTSAEWQPGTPLGDFRILREIGRGGMGVVYEAQQLSLDRRIALKVLPFALTLDPRQLQRFKTEARAAAHLHHQNIVPIYSVGCERGVHFYAMQFVEGQSLAEVIQELRGDKETRRQGDKETKHLTTTRETDQDEKSAVSLAPCLLGSLSAGPLPDFFRNVAELGVQAAEALEHAHEYGVVHRDVKPGNVLLDAHGHLWIADFGLAQFQSDAVLTLTGDLLGTLRYMSPEQALARRGLVDHRTDLYSLGATLYELLTLQPAYSGRDREELLRQIAFEEPCPPRRVNPAIPADLETILLKAMAKGVEERYATARELRDDLHRFLEHQPIRARRPTLRERAAKWSRRHRGVVVTAVALLLLAAVGLAASTALIAREQWKTQAAYDRLTAEQDRTRAAYEAEAQQRARAEEGFRQARQAVDFLAEMTEEELADRPELQGLRRKLLQAALDYYQDFITQHGDDPSIQAELLASHLRVATILNEIGSRADAQAALARARQVEEKLARENRLPPAFGLGQPWGPGRPGFPRESGVFALLVHRSVQEDLKLSADQVQKAAQLAGKRRDLAWECRDLSPEETRVRFAGQEAQEKALVESLPGTASRRLKQIVWQQRGMLALNDADVAEALALSPGQQEKIRALFDETHPSRGGPPGFGGFPPDSRRRAESFVNVLTAAQKARWDELIGEPFKGEIRPSFRGPPGPGRDPPGFGRP